MLAGLLGLVVLGCVGHFVGSGEMGAWLLDTSVMAFFSHIRDYQFLVTKDWCLVSNTCHLPGLAPPCWHPGRQHVCGDSEPALQHSSAIFPGESSWHVRGPFVSLRIHSST